MSTESLTKRPVVTETKVHTTKGGGSNSIKITKPRVGDSEDSMELTGILLPTFEDGAGPVALGDLWNCRTNTVEGNLFDQKIEAKYLQADPIQTLDYSFRQCQKTEDVKDIMKISASLSIDLTGGMPITITGSGSYAKDEVTKFNEENIVVTYDTLTYQVRVRPSASEIISAQVKKLLQDKTIVATHYVQAVLVGGKATGTIKYSENVSDSKMKIDGKFSLVGKFGGVTIEAEASFEKLDEDLKKEYSTAVEVQAQPRFTKSPTTCAEMFTQVKEIDTLISNERHFPELDKRDPENPDFVMRVTGVPIRFKLVPISHILQDHNVDPIFKLLEEELMNDFSSWLFMLKDFSNTEFIKRRLADMQPSIVPILLDDFNPLTVTIREYSLEKANIAVALKQEMAKLYIEYKVSNGQTDPLRNVIIKCEQEFKPFEVEQKLLEFKEDAKKELAAIRASDVDGIVDDDGEPSIRFFSNETDLADWYNSERKIKVLLRTDYSNGSPTGVFLKLYDMSPTLVKYGVEVGVAFPNISKGEFTLTYKTQYETTVYQSQEIRFALEVLAISVDEGETISKLFYSINAALSGLNLPMHEYLFDVPNLVIVMKEYKEVVISETYCDLLARLTESFETWNFVFPIQALNTGVEMMRFFRQLRAYIPERYPNLKHRFLVGRFNNVSDKFYSPLLLLFKDNLVQAVCLDQLDILIMMEQLGKPEPDWTLLTFANMRDSCIYTPRADWAISVVQNLILEHQTFLTDPIADLPQFEDNDNEYLPSALEVTRASAMRDESNVLTTVARLALSDSLITDELEAVLAQHGWKDNEFASEMWKDVEWDTFLEDIKNFLYGQAPFLLKVVLALKELDKMSFTKPTSSSPESRLQILAEEMKPIVFAEPAEEYTDEELDQMIDKIISFIIDSPAFRTGVDISYKWRGITINETKIYEEITAEVKSYDGMPPKIRRIGIMKIFEKFIAQESTKDELFHLFHLLYLVEGMADTNLKSLKHVLLPMCKKYCTRVIENLSEDDYPRGQRRIEDSLTERQLFKTLGVLSELKYNYRLYLIHQELFNFSTLPAPVNIKTTIEKMTTYKFEDEQLETIWTNPKFLYALRQVANNEGVLETIITHLYAWTDGKQNTRAEDSDLMTQDEYFETQAQIDEKGLGDSQIEYPHWIPEDIAQKVKALVALRERPNYPYPTHWLTVQVMIEAFQIIFTRQAMPVDFAEVLLDNVQSISDIKTTLKELNVLHYWNEADELFDQPWSLDTVTDVLTALQLKFPDALVTKSENSKPDLSLQLTYSTNDKTNDQSGVIIVNSTWNKLVQTGTLKLIPYRKLVQLDQLNPIALTEYEEIEKSASTTLNYLTQQLQMKNGTTLRAHFFEKYINYPPVGPRPGVIDFGDGISTRNLGIFLCRGDIQTALFHLTDSFGSHLALMSMATTPIPLPFLITSIEQVAVPKTTNSVSTEPTQCLLLVHALKDIIVPEMEFLVPQPRLFRDPYRFVLTIRIGDTSDEMGRSSLINSHLMKDPSFFSSKNDPGSMFGRPLNRNGFLEFSWMSESTCDSIFWNNFVQPEYDGQRKEIIHLGLLHGDALLMPSLFEVIQPFVSCFVVFWKVTNFNELKAKKKILTQILGTKKKVMDVVLYPDPSIVEKVHDQNLIFKQVQGGSQHLVNKAKLQNIFSDAIAITVKSGEDNAITSVTEVTTPNNSIFSSITSGLSGTPKGAKPLTTNAPIRISLVKPVATPESNTLLHFIEKHSIGNVQDAITRDDNHSIVITKSLVLHFTAVLNLPVIQRDMSLLHLTWELDFLSRKSSVEWKERIAKLRAQIDEKFIMETKPDAKWTLETQQELRMSMEKFRRNTMSIQDLWRTMWHWTNRTASTNQSSRKSLERIGGDFVISGFPVEMFHPTHTPNHIWGNGVDKILELVPPTTRIVIISTFGLKSSGKSTFLNALFGLGFTEHSTTYGLQMRLVWLNQELQNSLDCDAFVIIDSEGVGGAENKIDETSDMLERKLVTFLLSISSVSLATILGPQLNELKDILEVSMAALSKLDQLQLTPDVYLVQQYLPEMVEGSRASDEFNNSVQGAIKVTTDLELQLGLRVTEAHRLKQIKSRNKHSEVVHPIRSRGSLVNQGQSEYADYAQDIQALYSKIIHVAATTRGNRLVFGDWFNKTKALWQEIHPLDVMFKCNTTNMVRELTDLDNNVNTVKKSIDAAFFYHEKKAEAVLNTDLEEFFDKGYSAGFDSELEKRLNALIAELQKVINSCDDLLDGTTQGGLRRIKQRKAMAAEPNPNSCYACLEAFKLRESLFAVMLKQTRGFLVEEEINRYTATVRDSIYERIRQGLIAWQIRTRQSVGDLFKSLEAIREEFSDDENEQWKKFLQYVSTLQFVIPARHRFHAELKEVYKNLPHVAINHSPDNEHVFPDLKSMIAFDVQIYNSALESAMNARKPEKMTWLQHDWILARVNDIPKQMKDDFESVLYRPGMARELQQRIQKVVSLFEEYCGEHLLPNFKWQVHFYTIQLFSKFIEGQQCSWDLQIVEPKDATQADKEIKGGNPLKVLREMRSDFSLNGFFIPL